MTDRKTLGEHIYYDLGAILNVEEFDRQLLQLLNETIREANKAPGPGHFRLYSIDSIYVEAGRIHVAGTAESVVVPRFRKIGRSVRRFVRKRIRGAAR